MTSFALAIGDGKRTEAFFWARADVDDDIEEVGPLKIPVNKFTSRWDCEEICKIE